MSELWDTDSYISGSTGGMVVAQLETVNSSSVPSTVACEEEETEKPQTTIRQQGILNSVDRGMKEAKVSLKDFTFGEAANKTPSPSHEDRKKSYLSTDNAERKQSNLSRRGSRFGSYSGAASPEGEEPPTAPYAADQSSEDNKKSKKGCCSILKKILCCCSCCKSNSTDEDDNTTADHQTATADNNAPDGSPKAESQRRASILS